MNQSSGGTATAPEAAATVPWYGEQIAQICKESNLAFIGILYLPNGAAPKGLEGVFVPGAFQLVARVSGMPTRGNVVLAISDTWVPQSILRKAQTLTEPTVFTAS